jgi:hypothetical protein
MIQPKETFENARKSEALSIGKQTCVVLQKRRSIGRCDADYFLKNKRKFCEWENGISFEHFTNPGMADRNETEASSKLVRGGSTLWINESA